MSKSKKLPVSELLRLACIYAENDRESFITCYAENSTEPAVEQATAFVEQIREYRKKRWGKSEQDVLRERLSGSRR